MTSLLPEQTETLRQLSELWRGTPFVLIGANALALQVDLEWRQTNDLDFAVSVALEDYPQASIVCPAGSAVVRANMPGARPRASEWTWFRPVQAFLRPVR